MKFAPYVQRALKKNDANLEKSRQVLEGKLREYRRDEKNKKREYEEEMIKIYTKVWNRPLLLESTGQFGENEMKANPRYNVEDSKKQLVKRSKYEDEKKHNEQYEQKRRRAIEQPPGQYLIENDDEYDQNENGDY